MRHLDLKRALALLCLASLAWLAPRDLSGEDSGSSPTFESAGASTAVSASGQAVVPPPPPGAPVPGVPGSPAPAPTQVQAVVPAPATTVPAPPGAPVPVSSPAQVPAPGPPAAVPVSAAPNVPLAAARASAPSPPVAPPAPAASPTPNADDVSLACHFGLGLNMSPLNLYGGKNNATPGPMIDARYWYSRTSAVELAFGGAASFADSGDLADGASLMNSYYAEEEEIGYRRRLAHPVPFVWITGILSLAALQSDSLTYSGANGSYHGAWSGLNAVYTAYLGVGFEAYLPFWPDLSVEGSVGLNPGGTVYLNSAQHYVWEWAIETNDSSLNALTGAVHYYF